MSSLAASDAHTALAAAKVIQPAWVRIMHWINAVAMILMIMSGWQIYNASPLFDFTLLARDHARRLARRRAALAFRGDVAVDGERPRLSHRSVLPPAASATSCCRSRRRGVISDTRAALTFKLVA